MARKAQSKQDSASNPTSDASQDTAQQMGQVDDNVATPAQTEAPVTQVSAYSACGGALRQAREKQGLSINDVSTSLRLSNKQIEAIEADHFHQLPQPSIVRGFIRNYAKILKVDSEPIIAAYNALIPNATPQSFTVKSNTSRSVIGENKVNFSPKLFLGMIILFGLIAASFYYYTAHIKPSGTLGSPALTPKSVELNADVTPNNANTEFALPAAQRETESVTPNTADTSATGASNTTEIALPLANNPASVATPSPSTQTNPASTVQQPIALPLNTAPAATPVAIPQLQTESSITAPKPVTTITEKPTSSALNDETTTISDTSATSGQKALSFTAHEETWVNIVNSRGKKIYSKVLAAGQTETITAATPLKIIVGNAKSTTLTMDGQAVDLATHTRSKVARLTIE